jgi:hypothetical protein
MQNLQLGSKGLAVRDLQTKLNLAAKPKPPLDVDGDFGPLTRGVVKAFQLAHCPPDDGIVGPLTRAALEAALPKGPPLNYTVPSHVFVKQDKEFSCWLAAAQMLIRWKEKRTGKTDSRHPDPSTYPHWSALYHSNVGINNAQIHRFARDMGFKVVPPMTPTPHSIESWLKWYGPLWVNGVRHITVIVGIRGPAHAPEVLVLDPELHFGSAGIWRNLYEWYALDNYSSPDSSVTTRAAFLRLP